MKKIFTLFTAVLMTASVFAQAPQSMSYQAVIRNAAGTLVTTQVGMRISILQTTSTGTAVYVETQTPTPNANGLVSLSIGTGTVVSGIFSTIDWSAGPYFIETETDPAGATAYSITGTSQLLSVPYALYAAKSGDATSSNFVDLTTAQTIAGAKIFNDGLTVNNQPFLPPVLAQSQIDAITTPIEGMFVYNSTQRKLQLYSVGNSNIINDGFSGTYTNGSDYLKQTFVVPASGSIIQIQLYAESPMGQPFAFSNLDLNGFSNQPAFFNNLTTSPQWETIDINPPVAVVAGQSMYFVINGPDLAVGALVLGSNSAYSNGSCASINGNAGQINGDDLMFRILITPANGNAYWLNLN